MIKINKILLFFVRNKTLIFHFFILYYIYSMHHLKCKLIYKHISKLKSKFTEKKMFSALNYNHFGIFFFPEVLKNTINIKKRTSQ